MDHLLQIENVGNPSDRISQIPESIVHRILAFNTPAQLVRMSVLSKNWYHLTASFPILDFCIHKFRSRQSFFKYVYYTTSRFCHQNVTAHKFNLRASLREPAEIDIVNRCLELVLRNGVNMLEIDITNSSESPSASSAKYRLPDVLLSVSVLESLGISGCELPSSLMVEVVKFKSLTRLSLENVAIDDEVIKYLTSSCPLLQVFHINRCHGFKRFCVHGHQNLQEVWICCNAPVERIDIEALNLSNLSIIDIEERGVPQMNLASCQKLTTVSYFGHLLPNLNGDRNFLSNFPFIENLVLVTNNCNSLKLSSHSLRTLVLHSDCDLEDIDFSTPNLVLFFYACNYRFLWHVIMDKRWPMLRDSNHLKACMHCYPNVYIDTLWFQKLRQFLDKKNGFKVLNLYIHAMYSQKFTELEQLKAIKLPPYELEHVELQLDSHHEESLAHVTFVEAVLWCCQPQSLTLRPPSHSTGFEEQNDVIKFAYEKLLEQEDEGHTNIQIVSPSSTEAQKHLTYLKSLSMALPHERNTITFIKEEVVQEETDSQRYAVMEFL